MKKFLSKITVAASSILFFIPITILLYQHCSKASDFSTMETSELVTKYTFFKEHQQKFNLAFIGSSKVYRHFNAILFDSLCHTHSFNLGSGGFRPIRSFNLLEKIYQEDIKLDYLLFELNRFETLNQNFNTSPSIRSLTGQYYSLVISSLLSSDYSYLRKLQYAGIYTFTLAYKYVGTGILAQLAKPKPNKTTPLTKNSPLLLENGFYSINDDVEENQKTEDIQRHVFLTKNKPLLMKMKETNTFDKPNNYYPNSLSYSHYLVELSERFKARGIRLIFVINPRNFSDEDVSFLNQVAFSLPDSSLIELYDSRQFPEFYEFDYSFDMAHLTKEGAHKYTRHLANAFNELISNKKVPVDTIPD